jgi:hypothetical protein
MEPLTVETTEDGKIVIKQDDVGAGESNIFIDPSQVALLVNSPTHNGESTTRNYPGSQLSTKGPNGTYYP